MIPGYLDPLRNTPESQQLPGNQIPLNCRMKVHSLVKGYFALWVHDPCSVLSFKQAPQLRVGFMFTPLPYGAQVSVAVSDPSLDRFICKQRACGTLEVQVDLCIEQQACQT